MGLLRNLGWLVADWSFAAYWQARALFGRARESDYHSGGLSPVLVIPGIWETWAFMRPLIEATHAAGHPVYVISALRSNGAPIAESAVAVAEFVEGRNLRDLLIVAHSKGGLIGKYAMALLDDAHRISGMVAISTPFSGSRFAPYLVIPSIRALSPRDRTIKRLAEFDEVNARIISVYSRFDAHIPEGSELIGAQNVELPTGGHFRILARPQTIGIVLERAARAAA